MTPCDLSQLVLPGFINLSQCLLGWEVHDRCPLIQLNIQAGISSITDADVNVVPYVTVYWRFSVVSETICVYIGLKSHYC